MRISSEMFIEQTRTTKDLPLDIIEWKDMYQSPSKYRQGEYYDVYEIVLADGTAVKLMSSSARLRRVVESLLREYEWLKHIPAGRLMSIGEGMNKHFIYETRE